MRFQNSMSNFISHMFVCRAWSFFVPAIVMIVVGILLFLFLAVGENTSLKILIRP